MEINVSETANLLSAQFPQEMEKTIVKSGVELIYLPISEVINRLNKVIGVDNWSFEIISVQRDSNDIDEVVAHVVLSAKIGENTVVKHGIGGQQIKRSRKDNRVIDLGNDFKGAVSDAQKKAAQQLGIGLYLARSADALDAEEAIEIHNAPINVTQNVLVTEVDERWGAFVEIVSGLSKDQKDDLNRFWNSYAGGRSKPTKANATLEDLEPLIVEALRLRFDGSYASEAS